MEFTIKAASANGLEQVVLTDPNLGTSAIILPAHGAMLHAFTVQTKQGAHNIIDNYADASALKEQLSYSFKSSKLSPFACRIPGGKYMYDGEEFEMQHKFVDGSAIHGLLYNKPFKQMALFADEERASAAFRYHYKAEDDGYPFDYTCEVRYTLLPQNTLQVQTTIINLDDLPIPMSDGWHPYFTLGGKVNDWLLYFGADALLEFNAQLVPTGKLLPYDHFHHAQLIGDTVLDNCFLLNEDRSYAACTLRSETTGIQLNIFPDASYPFLQIFTPDHRQGIAIENLSAAPDAFNNKIGLLMLQPRHTQTFTVHYQVDCQ
ncbi:MAG: aldose 1-epimerase [Chitinophagaceae bacterium]